MSFSHNTKEFTLTPYGQRILLDNIGLAHLAANRIINRTCLHRLREDITQQAILGLAYGIHTVDLWNRSHPQAVKHYYNWSRSFIQRMLNKVSSIRNEGHDTYRESHVLDYRKSTLKQIEENELVDRICALVDIESKWGRALYLYYWKGHSYEQIRKILDLKNKQTAHQWVLKELERLREALDVEALEQTEGQIQMYRKYKEKARKASFHIRVSVMDNKVDIDQERRASATVRKHYQKKKSLANNTKD